MYTGGQTHTFLWSTLENRTKVKEFLFLKKLNKTEMILVRSSMVHPTVGSGMG